MALAAGLADVRTAIEPVDKLRSRAERLAKIIEPDRLWLAPSCGFGRSRSPDVAREKVANLVAAARTF
jgi:methionine synthase II (cobalamin-independent)